MLAYGRIVESIDEYIKMGKSLALECINIFVGMSLYVFGEEYSRRPTVGDLMWLLTKVEERIS